MATLGILNLVLFVTALFLAVNIIDEGKLTGSVVFAIDKSEPRCFIEYGGDTSDISDLNQCCFLLQEQLACYHAGINSADFACSTSEFGLKYLANAKAVAYCRGEGYRLKTK